MTSFPGRLLGAGFALLISISAASPVSAACVGDCGGDGNVTVDEIATLIAISTAQRPIGDCPDPNRDESISIEEIVGAVGNSLSGCPRTNRRFLYPGPQLPTQFPIELVDFNRDGTLDVVAPGAVLLNNGHASFSTGPRGFPSHGEDVASGYLDDDAEIDFVTSSRADDYVILRLSSDVSATVPTGDQPIAVVSADIDGDGNADIATADAGTSTISIHLGDGHGVFTSGPVVPLGFVPALLEAADLNSDGKSELLVAPHDSDSLAIFRHGESALQSLRAAPEGAKISQLVIRDIDLDGKLDLITVDAEAGSVIVLLGNGDGTFRAAPTSPVYPLASAVAVGDFDGDGVSDMAIGSAADAGEVGVFLGGRSCDGACSTFTIGAPVVSLVAGDLTGDGYADLIVQPGDSRGSSGGAIPTIVEGNGDGTFHGQHRSLDGKLASFRYADFDGDHSLDVLRMSEDPEGFESYLRSPDGRLERAGFAPLVPFSSSSPLYTPEYVATGDFDDDGATDFATVRVTEGAVHVYWGNGDGTFQNAQAFLVGDEPRSVVAADLNGDGRDDLLTANYGSGDLTLLHSSGARQFERDTLSAGDGPYLLAIADIDGDGRNDIVATNDASNDISIRLAGEAYSFAAEKELSFAADGVDTYSVLAHDLNDDGLADLVFAPASGYFVVLLGRGDGSFHAPRRYPASVVLFGPIEAADANGDGHADLFIPDLASILSLWLGDGRGDFVGPFNFSAGAAFDRNIPTDLNGDGVADVLASNFYSGTAEVYGAGCDKPSAYAVGYPQTIAWTGGGYTTPAFAAADLNADGRPDLVSNGQLGAFVRLTGAGGELGSPQPLEDSGFASAIGVADLDADGDLDIVTAYDRGGSIFIHYGDGSGAFALAAWMTVGFQPVALLLADLNGDARIDITTLNAGGEGSLNVLLRSAEGVYESNGNFPAPLALNHSYVRPMPSGDFDGDGTLDLAIPTTTGIAILPGLGDGRFAAAREIPGLPSRATDIVTGDYNEDGAVDLAYTDSGDYVTIVLGNADGSFEVSGRVFATTEMLALDAADVDRDGHLDLVVAPYNTEEVTILLGRGDGTFPTSRRFAGDYGAINVNVLDFDVDGDLDVLTASLGGIISTHAGMFISCADPHDTRHYLPNATCALCPDGVQQVLKCNSLSPPVCEPQS